MNAGNAVDVIRAALTLTTVLLCALIWLGITAFLRRKKHKSAVYLTLFTILYVYIVKVLDYTLFQFQSLLLLRHFTSHLILSGQAAGESVNLIPLVTLTREDVRTSLLNILLLLPFGLGLPFIANVRMKQTLVLGACFAIGIEVLQLITGLVGHMTFRIADINDVIFNTLGAAIGYLLFAGMVRVFPTMAQALQVSMKPSSNSTSHS